jgi:hypothetical protein
MAYMHEIYVYVITDKVDSHRVPAETVETPHGPTKLSAQNMEYKSYKKSETFIIATCLDSGNSRCMRSFVI